MSGAGQEQLPGVGRLTDVTAGSGLEKAVESGSPEKLWILESVGSGCAFLDADGDRRLDVFVASGGKVTHGNVHPGPGGFFYRQVGNGRFQDATETAGLAFEGWATGVAVGDFNNDGKPDLFVGCYGQDRLFKNVGGRFEDVTAEAGLLLNSALRDFSTSATFLDFDRDGRLDLYVTRYVDFDPSQPPNDGFPCRQGEIEIACPPTFHPALPDRLYRNVDGSRFVDVSREVGIQTSEGAYGLGVVAGDFDGDGFTDLYVANDTTANFLWHNVDGKHFEELALFSGAALSDEGQGQAGMGVATGDLDGDQDLDLAVTNYSLESNAFYLNSGGGRFEDIGPSHILSRSSYLLLGWGIQLGDLNLDGRLDLVTANGHVYPAIAQADSSLRYDQPCQVLLGTGGGTFRDATTECGQAAALPRAHRGLATGDFDNDGDLDVLLTVQDSPAVLLRNDSPPPHNWVSLRLLGARSNREAIGAEVRLRTGKAVQLRQVSRGGSYLSARDVRLFFGLGEARQVDEVRITWPGGEIEVLRALDANRFYDVVEGTGVAEPIRVDRP